MKITQQLIIKTHDSIPDAIFVGKDGTIKTILQAIADKLKINYSEVKAHKPVVQKRTIARLGEIQDAKDDAAAAAAGE